MDEIDYVSITEAMPPEGSSPKVRIHGLSRKGGRIGRVLMGSEKWNYLVTKHGSEVRWKPHWTEGGPKDER